MLSEQKYVPKLMGCSSSLTSVSRTSFRQRTITPMDQHCNELSATVKYDIIRTWNTLSEDNVRHGVKILLKLFALNPAIKAVFIHLDNKNVEVFRENMFTIHALKMMQVIENVVDNIDDFNYKLDPLLHELGKHHFNFKGFRQTFWDSCPEAILFVWQRELQEKFSTDISKAWFKVLTRIVMKLKLGYQQAALEVSTDSTGVLNNAL